MSDAPVASEGQLWDAPNQQVVLDGTPPWEEGTGGEPGEPVTAEAADTAELDEMTKAELLDYAQAVGVSPANNNMSKDELRDAIDAHLAEGG